MITSSFAHFSYSSPWLCSLCSDCVTSGAVVSYLPCGLARLARFWYPIVDVVTAHLYACTYNLYILDSDIWPITSCYNESVSRWSYMNIQAVPCLSWLDTLLV